MTRLPEAAGVVVPAHDEEALLPACLAALRRAVDAVRIPVCVLVVADACADRTADTARACGAAVITVRGRNVGAARAAGMAEIVRQNALRDPAAVWLATTDAVYQQQVLHRTDLSPHAMMVG